MVHFTDLAFGFGRCGSGFFVDRFRDRLVYLNARSRAFVIAAFMGVDDGGVHFLKETDDNNVDQIMLHPVRSRHVGH